MRPLPYEAIRSFVEREGWTRRGNSRGSGKRGDHDRYELTLANGNILYTRISHGSGQYDDPRLIAEILRVQLAVTEEDFWACVEKATLPPRPQPPTPQVPKEALDYKLARNLINKVGLAEDEIFSMSKEEAVRRWQEYLAQGGS